MIARNQAARDADFVSMMRMVEAPDKDFKAFVKKLRSHSE